MRKFLAIATFVGVGVFSLFGMSHSVFASYMDPSVGNINPTYYKTDFCPSLVGASWKFNDYITQGNYQANTTGGLSCTNLNVAAWGDSTGVIFEVIVWDDVGFSGNELIHDILVYDGVGWVVFSLEDYLNQSTRFVSFSPSGDSVVASSSATTTEIKLYVNVDEWDDSYRLIFNLSYVNEVGVVESLFFDGYKNLDLREGSYDYALPGINTFSTTTDLSRDGKYLWSAKVVKDKSFWAGLIFGGYDVVISTSTYFWVGSSTSYRQSGINEFQDRLEALMASSTYAVGASCSPLSSSFDFANCLADVLYPGTDALSEDLLLIKQMPPWGYLFRVYDIFSDVATSSLPSISAVVPPGVIGSGATVELDPNGVFDFILYATSSGFVSGNATSTETFFDITNTYFSYICYIGLFIYMLFRIIGLRRVNI